MAYMKWTTEKIKYLEENYHKLGADAISKEWGVSYQTITARAHAMNLTNSTGWHKTKKPQQINYNKNPITNATRTLVCGSIVRGDTVEIIAKEINRSVEQITELLQECKESGYYDAIKKYIDGEYKESACRHSIDRVNQRRIALYG